MSIFSRLFAHKEEAVFEEQEYERPRALESIFKTSHVVSAIKDARDRCPKAYPINNTYRHVFRVQSRASFDGFNFEKRITEHIGENISFYEDIYCKAIENGINWKSVLSAVEDAESVPVDESVIEELGIDEEEYRREEFALVNLMLRNAPVSDPSFVFGLRYESPAGKSTLWSERTIRLDDMLLYFERVESIRDRRKSDAYRRQLITPRKRLKIFTKDHFRCCLCGRSQNDGAELNVDHFIPIAKGGTSDDDNLWTLCWDCNHGKSDYEIPELQEMFDQAMRERNE